MFKSGYVSILGKPNTGKSTLLNKLVNEKISIVTFKPQTTRDNILGVLTDKNFQIAFIDTPGILKVKDGLSRYMMNNVKDASLKATPSLRGVVIETALFSKAVKKDKPIDKELINVLNVLSI